MEQYVKLLEQSGFSVVNANDYENIEIRDLKNNNEILKKSITDNNNYSFSGSGDREIVASEKWISIVCENGLFISYSFANPNMHNYEIEITLNDGTKYSVDISRFFGHGIDFIGGILVTVGCEQNIDKKITRTLHGKLNMGQGMLNGNIVYNEDVHNSKNYDIENCNTEFYMDIIVNFLNSIKSISDNSKFKEAIRIVLPLISEHIDNIFVIHGESFEHYIQKLEESKVWETEQYQVKIKGIDNKIKRTFS